MEKILDEGPGFIDEARGPDLPG